MPPASPSSQSTRTSSRALYAAVAAAILIVTAAVTIALVELRHQAELRAAINTQNLARSIVLTFDGLIDTVDIALQASSDEISRQTAAGKVNATSVTAFLEQQKQRVPHIAFLRATNAAGDVIYGPGIPSPPANNADREFFIHLRDYPAAGLFVAQPIVGRIANRWLWSFARRINGPDGSFRGVVFASIFVDEIQQMLTDFRIESDGAIALRDVGLGLIARHTFARANPIAPGDTHLSAPFVAALKANPQSGTFISDASGRDDFSRIYSYQRSGKHGFLVNVGIGRDAALAEWRQQATLIGSLAGLFILGAIVFLRAVTQAWRRQAADLIALQASQASLREAQQIAHLGQYRYALRTNFWTSSEILDGIFGIDESYPRDASHWLQLVAPDARPDMQVYLERIVTQRLPFDREYPIIRASDGRQRWVHGLGELEFDTNGAPHTLIGTIQDITERRLNQQRMEHLLAEQRAVLESDLVGFVTVHHRTIVWASPSFEKILGYAPGELVGVPTRQNYPSDAAYAAFGSAAYPLLQSGTVYRSQVEQVRKDGRHIWVDVSGTLLDRASGESLWSFVDITERRQLERDIAASEQRMELALAGADLGMWDLDLPTEHFTHNTRLLEMFGFETANIEPSVKNFVSAIHPDDAPAFWAAFVAHIKGTTPTFEAEYRVRHQDERWIWLLSRGKVVERDASGRAVRMTGTTLDISARKQAEAALAAREARLATLIASMQDIVVVLDTGGTVIEYFHPQNASRPPIRARDQIIGAAYSDILPDGVATQLSEAIVGIMTDGKPQRFEYALVIDDRNYLSLATMSPLMGEAKYPLGFLLVIRDITAERAAQDEVERLARRTALLLESVGEGIYGIDMDKRATFVNAAALAMLGLSEAEIIGQDPHRLFHHHYQDGSAYPAADCPLAQTLADARIRHVEDEWYWRKDGSGFAVAMTVTPVLENGAQVGGVVIFQDISERKAIETKIREMAFYDPLTHLPNRRLLLDRLDLALPTSARRNSYGAILFLDLDNFKILNDTRGHDFGDLLLAEAARRLLSCVRIEDTVARLGGDEFVIMLEDLSATPAQAATQAEAVANKILGALGVAYMLPGCTHVCTTSIGICLFRGSEAHSGELLKRADAAMYQAKAAGRNTIRIFQGPA